MGESVITALITGGLALIGTIITVTATASKTRQKVEVEQAKTALKIETLTKEVEKHNGFGQRIPVIEERVEQLTRRIDDIERKVEN